MSQPIDFIDLTKDSPENKTLRLRRVRSTQQSKLNNPPIYILTDKSYKDSQSTEVIDVDNINVPENTTIQEKNSNEPRRGVLCPICYDDLSSDKLPISTKCGHIFCKNCLTEALQRSKKCPKCKKIIRLQSCHRIYF